MSAANLALSLPLAPTEPSARPSPGERFQTLVERYSSDLFRYAYWLCGERATAEDLVQDTFLRAWRSLASMRDEGAAKAWLLTILRRENARRFERYRPGIDDVESDSLPGGRAHDTSTEAFVLRRAVTALPVEYREPLVLQVLGGYSCEEIGQILGLTRGAVMTRVFRAKQKLRKVLAGDADELVPAHG